MAYWIRIYLVVSLTMFQILWVYYRIESGRKDKWTVAFYFSRFQTYYDFVFVISILTSFFCGPRLTMLCLLMGQARVIMSLSYQD